MNQNLWLKYALYSFLGVLILMAVTGLMQNSMNDNGMSSMNNMNMQAPMQGMAVGEMPMNGMAAVYPCFNGGMMSAMPVSMGRSYTPVYNQFVNNGIPVNGIQVGGVVMNAMPMISIPMVSIPVNTVFAPMYGATMNSMVMPGLGFNSLPMTGM